MLESLMLIAQLNVQPQIYDGLYIPDRVNVRVGDYESAWIAPTRTANQCKQYASEQGYERYVWSPSLQPAGGNLHLTGECNGVRKNKPGHRIEALEHELNQVRD